MAATDDYKLSAPLYQETIDNQGRTETPIVVDSSQQFDRDNLLHFIEDKFKSNVRGGISPYNLRTLLHSIVKSFVNLADDNLRSSTLFGASARISMYASTRYYYGHSSYGYNANSWTSYTSSLSAFSKTNTFASYKTAFAVRDVSVKGSIKMSSMTGNIEVTLAYCDPDDGLSSPTYVDMNVVATQNVTSTVLHDVYDISINTTSTIPPNKHIFVFFRFTNHPNSSTKYVSMQYSVNHKI